jgi:DDE_Tnp_1-associated
MVLAALKQVPDFRQKRGQSYQLWSLLALILVGFLCGRHGLMAVFRMGRALPLKARLQLGFGRYKMPAIRR